MERWLRATRTAALGFVVPAMLASCGGGGGGGSLRLFFGITGNGSCDRIVVDVDLEAANAVLDRLDDQSVDCALNALLDTAGCEVTFVELDDGDTLRATIEDCTIPAVSALFECGFSEADVSEFDDEAFASCECASPGCDQTPPVCVSGDDDPRSCEDCDNGLDDDLDGLEDCEDPNCSYDPGCVPDTTTTTVPDTTTTTFLDPTTTTLPELLDCAVTFRLNDDVTAGSLQWIADFSATSGSFEGSGQNVECDSLVAETLSAFNEQPNETLEAGLISVVGIDGPVDLIRCRWRGTTKPEPEDFGISEVEAATVDLVLLPDPDIAVSSVQCGGGDTTTTTTTLPDDTTTTTVDVPATPSTVAFKLDSSSAPLGALQLLIAYGSAPGEFDGTDAAVKCVNKVPDALTARNDDETTRELSLGFISLDGFSAPIVLAECAFLGSVPDAEDFVVTIEDAAGVNSEPATALVSVEVIVTP